MRLRNTPDHYGAIPLALHWAVAILVIGAWLTGDLDDLLAAGAPRAAGLFVHMSMGLAIVALVVIRLLWRIGDPPPAPEHTVLGQWLDHAGRLTHYALYALLVAIPVVGITLQFARGNAVPVFGLFEIASPWPADRAFARSIKGVHELLANALLVLAGLHAAAALAHHVILRDRTLLRMLPASRR